MELDIETSNFKINVWTKNYCSNNPIVVRINSSKINFSCSIKHTLKIFMEN